MDVDTVEKGISATVVAVSIIINALAALMAILPQGRPGTAWDKIRTVINYIAFNWGNAKNIQQFKE